MSDESDATEVRWVRPATPEQLTAFAASLFEGYIGLQFSELEPERVRASLTIIPALRQAGGVTRRRVLLDGRTRRQRRGHDCVEGQGLCSGGQQQHRLSPRNS